MTVPLRTTDLTAGYQVGRAHTPVLSGLNLSVQTGELVCLLGPNGTGKSTLIRTIGRLQPALSGLVEINGTDLRKLTQSVLARQIGMVLTERPAVGAMPAYQVVELGRYPHLNWLGQLQPRDHSVVRWAIAAVSAEHLASRDARTLSDGEHQRFMIARALAQEPLILLLDEPTAFLDVPSRVEMMGLLRQLARDQKIAIVVSTHDLELALRMADTVWLIGRGGQIFRGTPEDLVLAGRVEEAFPGDSIRFDPEERAFRPAQGRKGCAVIHGNGLPAALAAAVLEREGYEIVSDRLEALQLTISSSSSEWEVVVGRDCHRGVDFSELAAFARTFAEKAACELLGKENPT